MDIRLIAADFDGTLLSPDGRVSAFNKKMIEKALAAGIVFAAATGRFAENASQMMLDEGIVCPIISTNGAVVELAPYGERVLDITMNPETARLVLERLEGKPVCYYMFGHGTVYTRHREWQRHISERNREHFLKLKKRVKYFYGKKACLEALKHPIHKYFVTYPKGFEGIEAEMESFSDIPNLEVTRSGANNAELISNRAGKAVGLQKLCEALGVRREQVMALGDNQNDLSMLEWAGLGVAMGNAGEDIKRRSDAVTAANTEDGVGRAIERYCFGMM